MKGQIWIWIFYTSSWTKPPPGARNQFIQVQELETTEIEMTPDVSPEPPEEHGYRCRGADRMGQGWGSGVRRRCPPPGFSGFAMAMRRFLLEPVQC